MDKNNIVYGSRISADFKPKEGYQLALCPLCGNDVWARPGLEIEFVKVLGEGEKRIIYVCTPCMLKESNLDEE